MIWFDLSFLPSIFPYFSPRSRLVLVFLPVLFIRPKCLFFLLVWLHIVLIRYSLGLSKPSKLPFANQMISSFVFCSCLYNSLLIFTSILKSIFTALILFYIIFVLVFFVVHVSLAYVRIGHFPKKRISFWA